MTKGFKYRIYPNKEQTQQLNQMLGNARFVYNWALDRRIKEYQAEKKSVSAFTVGGMVSCRLRGTSVSTNTKLKAGGNASN